jgi:hypothetical protein
MADSTSIFDLPVDPVGGGNNVVMSASEKTNTIYVPDIPPQVGPTQNNNGSGVSLDQSTINSIVNGLQQASSTGATMLPSRDIPREQEHMVRDQQIQPNYIPQPSQVDYIQQHEQNNEIIEAQQYKDKHTSTLDSMYDELQTPLLLCVLFFLFQLPFFKKNLFVYVPALFLNDGNYNIYGYVFMSILFSLVYYVFSKFPVS